MRIQGNKNKQTLELPIKQAIFTYKRDYKV